MILTTCSWRLLSRTDERRILRWMFVITGMLMPRSPSVFLFIFSSCSSYFHQVRAHSRSLKTNRRFPVSELRRSHPASWGLSKIRPKDGRSRGNLKDECRLTIAAVMILGQIFLTHEYREVNGTVCQLSGRWCQPRRQEWVMVVVSAVLKKASVVVEEYL